MGGGQLRSPPVPRAADLARRKVDIIVAASTPAVQAAKQATRTIPIVMTLVSDPVESGIVTSVARPGGNVTGLSLMHPELGGKRSSGPQRNGGCGRWWNATDPLWGIELVLLRH
jgi:ABC transporter substrate binding protein